ncbi:hypothetical protein DQF64_03155 [Moraxella bovis]|nr:hypothetical protein DQF64_03155 [Moraxella bovis]
MIKICTIFFFFTKKFLKFDVWRVILGDNFCQFWIFRHFLAGWTDILAEMSIFDMDKIFTCQKLLPKFVILADFGHK